MSILVAGCCTVDQIVHVESLPKSQDSLCIDKSIFRLGGCAYNVACAIKDCTFVSTCGQGLFADYVRNEIMKEDFEVCLPFKKGENGYCLCLVEPNGQRSFVAYHGVEYTYDVDVLCDLDGYDYTYVCGMDLEEDDSILGYLENASTQIFFACGPRLKYIGKDLVERILKLHPILHMNAKELKEWTNLSLEDGMRFLYEQTSNVVIVTDGHRGSYAYDGLLHFVKSDSIHCLDTTGAGDHHAGICLKCMDLGMDVDLMLKKANDSCLEMLKSR